jgi:hypothetical protein
VYPGDWPDRRPVRELGQAGRLKCNDSRGF